ncbi:MAG: gluconate 2-dehydrogenase subunit 3 family protein [Hyalangium sp.]|uniref:gluconate 2-dehydrogenase subunit 3 family protein n=1 Tax=Hyalangium sp. TaxID=2028555 RepID=UPI00389A777E
MKNLSATDYETANAIAATLLPSDDMPGAADTPVVPMVIGMLKDRPEQFELFRSALAHVNQLARSTYGDELAQLPPPSREALVGSLSSLPELVSFWQLFRTLLMLRFYSIPKVCRSIGLPGPSIDQGGPPRGPPGRDHGSPS